MNPKERKRKEKANTHTQHMYTQQTSSQRVTKKRDEEKEKVMCQETERRRSDEHPKRGLSSLC